MSIQRHDPSSILSQAVQYGDTVYLAGVVAKDLDNGHLLIWQGNGHTAYPKTTCVSRAVNAYLVNGQLPAAGTACPVK